MSPGFFLLFHHFVVFRENHTWLECFCLLKVHESIGNDDADIAHLHLACGGTIETYATAASLTFYNIGFESLTVVVINNLHLLAGDHVGSIEQVLVDGDTAHIVEVGLGDCHTMQF